ncbi:hypothetical protein C8R43DRAFT_877346, partial [Mycena crocata]
HSRFWYDDGNIVLQAGHMQYKLHRYLFDQSTALPLTPTSSGSWMLNATQTDFDRLLSVLYPANRSEHECKTVEEWTSVLHLADLWHMDDIRRLAIAQLAQCAGPVDRIALGHQYKITEWLGPAYLALVMRKESITAEEGEKLGVDAMVRIRDLENEVFFEDPAKYVDQERFSELFASKLTV